MSAEQALEELVADIRADIERVTAEFVGASIGEVALRRFAVSIGAQLNRWSKAAGAGEVHVSARADGHRVTIDVQAQPDTLIRLFDEMPGVLALMAVDEPPAPSLAERFRRLDAMNAQEITVVVTPPGDLS